MRIFVTGASGFIGGHVVERLVRDGHEVLALARSPKSAAAVERLGARAVAGELGAVDAAGLRGCDAIVHAAAFVSEWGAREEFWAANVEGTSQLLEAARAAGVPRFIHIGTEAALFDGHDLVDVDEAQPYPARQRFLYSETKAEAERRVLAANGEGLTTIVLRPRLVWGPRDTSVRAAIAEAAKAGRFAWVGGGRALTSTVHVENLTHAVALALTRGRGGQAYFIADEGSPGAPPSACSPTTRSRRCRSTRSSRRCARTAPRCRATRRSGCAPTCRRSPPPRRASRSSSGSSRTMGTPPTG